jgi:hypothetical protein
MQHEPTERDILTGVKKVATFVSYYRTLGVFHVFVSVPLDLGSSLMAVVLQALKEHINAGELTIMSTSFPGVDGASGMQGMLLKRKMAEDIVQTLCLYLLKGVASHALIAELDDFVYIFPPLTSIQPLLDFSEHERSKKPCKYIHCYSTRIEHKCA